MKKIKVLATGAGGVSVGHQIIQSLREHPESYEIGATDISPYSYGLYEADAGFVVPRGDDGSYIPVMLDICREFGYRVIVPGSEVELIPLGRNKSRFEEIGVTVLVNAPEIIERYLNKWNMFQNLPRLGFDTPRSALLKDWRVLVSETGYPVIVKPVAESGGSRNVEIVFADAEAEELVAKLNGEDFLVQEYIGSGEGEYTVGVLTDPAGNIIDSIVLKRILEGVSLKRKIRRKAAEYSISSGITQGEIVEDHEISEYCERLAVAIGIRGPLNVQCRKADGKIYAFEVHPRFSGSAYIRTAAGFNEPHILIRSFVRGESISRITYRKGITAIRGIHHVIIDADAMKTVHNFIKK